MYPCLHTRRHTGAAICAKHHGKRIRVVDRTRTAREIFFYFRFCLPLYFLLRLYVQIIHIWEKNSNVDVAQIFF